MASDAGPEQERGHRKGTKKEGRTVHFATLKDFCHLKNSELQPKFQKYKRRVVLRRDAVKDDSGSYASFTEQGSSASQMTAAKGAGRYCLTTWMPWSINRRSISAYTQVKIGGRSDTAETSQV